MEERARATTIACRNIPKRKYHSMPHACIKRRADAIQCTSLTMSGLLK